MSLQQQIDQINQVIVGKGYKMTAQREATVRVILEHKDDHLRAEDIYVRVKAKFPEIGIATVYRSLALLTKLRIIEKINLGNGVALFDLRREKMKHMHHHLICTRCLKMEEIQEDWLLDLEERLKNEVGFEVTDHRLEFTGVFQSCNKGHCAKKHKVNA